MYNYSQHNRLHQSFLTQLIDVKILLHDGASKNTFSIFLRPSAGPRVGKYLAVEYVWERRGQGCYRIPAATSWLLLTFVKRRLGGDLAIAFFFFLYQTFYGDRVCDGIVGASVFWNMRLDLMEPIAIRSGHSLEG